MSQASESSAQWVLGAGHTGAVSPRGGTGFRGDEMEELSVAQKVPRTLVLPPVHKAAVKAQCSMGRLAQKLVFWTWPEGHVWPGEGPGVWAPMTPDGLAFTATGGLCRHGFLCLDPGDQSLGGGNTEGTVEGPYCVSEPLRHCSPGTHSLLLPS